MVGITATDEWRALLAHHAAIRDRHLRDLFAQDPFVAEGVFASYEVSRWAMTINKSVGR